MPPQSEIRMTLAAALLDSPGTTRQLAQRTGWSIGYTRAALDNMCRAGDACSATRVRVPGVNRPVPVYRWAIRPADFADPSSQPVASVTAASLGPAYAVRGGGM